MQHICCRNARVSSSKDAMLHSLSVQVSCYCGYIQRYAGWEYVDAYADKAKTGRKDNRENFQRMLSDCRTEKIDLIITKSVSRFARNTVVIIVPIERDVLTRPVCVAELWPAVVIRPSIVDMTMLAHRNTGA